MQLYLPIAEMSLNVLVLLCMGLSVGILSGIFGIGGGFILTPLLIMVGVPPAIAVGTGASQVVASSVSGAIGHWFRGNVDAKLGFMLLGGGFVGTFVGVRLQQLLKSLGQLDLAISLAYVVILGAVGSLMLIEGLSAWRKAATAKTPAKTRRAGQHSWVQGLPLKTRFRRSKIYMSALPPLMIGAFVGFLTAIMGVGGGFIMVPALIYLLGVPTRIVVGTSVFQIVFVTALTTVLQSMQNHTVDIALGAPLMAGGVIGAQYGIRIADRLKAEQLRVFLAALVLAMGVRMAVDLVIPPSEIYNLDVRFKPQYFPETNDAEDKEPSGGDGRK